MAKRLTFRTGSIRAKLALLIGVSGTFALLLLSVFVLTYEGYLQKRAASRELSVQAVIVARNCTAALSFDDEEAAKEILAALRGDSTLSNAAIFDRNNLLFAAYSQGTQTALSGIISPANARSGAVLADHDSLIVFQPVLLRGERIGVVFLRKSLGEFGSEMKRYFGILLLAFLGSLGIAFLIGARMQRSITGPISALTEIARRVSNERDYSVRAPRGGDGEIGFLVDSFNEMISQIEMRSNALQESEERYALAARGANDGLWDWKLATDEIYFSSRWNQMLGLPDAEKWSTPEVWFSRIHAADRLRVRAEFQAHREGHTTELVSEYRMRRNDGTFLWMLSRGLCVRDSAGVAVRMAGSQSDITEGKVADPLTGLPNRLFFIDRLESSIESLKSGGAEFAVLFLDLDRFKLVNDSLGHAAGDDLLVEIASRLRSSVHSDAHVSSVVARLGGDEFAVLLSPVYRTSDVSEVANRILRKLSVPFQIDGRQIFPGVSIGAALSCSANTPEDLLRNADTAMYCAKTGGKGRYEIFDAGMRESAVERLKIETELRKAVEESQFVLYYQPKVSLPDGAFTGCEALVRWQHPERGLLQPGSFISVTEETDLIVPLGRWILTEACRQMAEWRRLFAVRPSYSVAVNVSYRQLTCEGFVEDVARILRETGLPGECLRLELTESTLMSNTEDTIATLRRLKMLNVGLEIDDFGTGYSSLSCLSRLPFDTVKIDQSFMKDLSSNEESRDVVRTILELARSMGMNAVAEGVESSAQMETLNALGCDFAQGFYFSKPITAMAQAVLLSDAAMKEAFAHLSGGTRVPDPGVNSEVLVTEVLVTEVLVTNEK